MPPFIKIILGDRPSYALYSNIIKFITDNGASVTITGGMYGKHSKHITLPESAYQQFCGRKAYYTAFSKYGISTNYHTETFECSTSIMASMTDAKREYCDTIFQYYRPKTHPTAKLIDDENDLSFFAM